jgi:hypothetical protein
MRRRFLHIAAASLAFTLGFLTDSNFDNLISALPLTICVFALTQTIRELHFNLPSD